GVGGGELGLAGAGGGGGAVGGGPEHVAPEPGEPCDLPFDQGLSDRQDRAGAGDVVGPVLPQGYPQEVPGAGDLDLVPGASGLEDVAEHLPALDFPGRPLGRLLELLGDPLRIAVQLLGQLDGGELLVLLPALGGPSS